jgi:hypothetical protein
MGRNAIWRVWYGKRLGILQSFEDIGSSDAAAIFAAFIEADRIEVVRQLAPCQPPRWPHDSTFGICDWHRCAGDLG